MAQFSCFSSYIFKFLSFDWINSNEKCRFLITNAFGTVFIKNVGIRVQSVNIVLIPSAIFFKRCFTSSWKLRFLSISTPRNLTLLGSVIILFPLFIDSGLLKFLLRLNRMNSVFDGFNCSFKLMKSLVSHITFFL